MIEIVSVSDNGKVKKVQVAFYFDPLIVYASAVDNNRVPFKQVVKGSSKLTAGNLLALKNGELIENIQTASYASTVTNDDILLDLESRYNDTMISAQEKYEKTFNHAFDFFDRSVWS